MVLWGMAYLGDVKQSSRHTSFVCNSRCTVLFFISIIMLLFSALNSYILLLYSLLWYQFIQNMYDSTFLVALPIPSRPFSIRRKFCCTDGISILFEKRLFLFHYISMIIVEELYLTTIWILKKTLSRNPNESRPTTVLPHLGSTYFCRTLKKS